MPDILDHDYWIARPADGDQIVIRMYYDGDGRFAGAAQIPADQHEPYDREIRLEWAIGEPFDTWWARHGSCTAPRRPDQVPPRRRGDESSRDELSRLLIALRGHRSQTEVAELAGLTQAKVLRRARPLPHVGR